MAKRFDELLYNDDVLDALYDMGFEECTPIQELAIPVISEGHDLIGVAQTGTGKTAAYLLPVIDILADGGYPEDAINCVVMAPTRELAQQIDQQMQGFSYFMPVSGTAIYGGTDGSGFEQQRQALKRGADVVIATPGRLLAHLSMGYVDLSQVSFFILDEADRMLDMGFYDDIMQIVAHLPKERQTLMFSATMPPKIKQLAANILRNPKEVKLQVSKPADKIRQLACICYEPQKLPILKQILMQEDFERVIVFAGSKIKVKELGRNLSSGKSGKKGENKGEPRLRVGVMHSDLSQEERDNVMLDFKAKRTNVLVATDIVARGIDIDDISMVVNFDVPREGEDYVHRVGRTARADNDGKALTFVTEKEIRKFHKIEKFIEKKVERLPVAENFGEAPDENAAAASRNSRPSSRGRKSGKGGGGKSPKAKAASRPNEKRVAASAEKTDAAGNRSDKPHNPKRRNRTRRKRNPDKPES